MFTNLKLMYWLLFVFLFPPVCLADEHFQCSFLKKADVMSDMITDENSVQGSDSNLDLVNILSEPILINVEKESMIYTIQVYESSQNIKFDILSRIKNTIFALSTEDKFITLFADSQMVFTEIVSASHVVNYFYSCVRHKH